MSQLIPIQFVAPDGDWSIQYWPAVPRVGDQVVLPDDSADEPHEDGLYVVRACVWEVDEMRPPAGATVYVTYLGSAWDPSLDRYTEAREPRQADQLDRMRSALQVIHTWATFDGGRPLVPEHVARLCRRALDDPTESKPPR